MFSSIQRFEEQGIKNLRKVEDRFIETKDIASFVNDVKTEALNLAMNIIAETLGRHEFCIMWSGLSFFEDKSEN